MLYMITLQHLRGILPNAYTFSMCDAVACVYMYILIYITPFRNVHGIIIVKNKNIKSSNCIRECIPTTLHSVYPVGFNTESF